MKKPTAKTKRKFPESVRVYFPKDKITLLREIERIAQEQYTPVSTLCVEMMWAGLPKIYAKLLHEKNEREKLITQQPAESIK